MDHKTFSLKVTNLDYQGRTIEGYANVFGVVDEVKDIVHPGAFSKTLNERGGKIKFLWQHDLSEPLGKIQEMREDDYGLKFRAIISDTQRGRDALALLKDGAVDSFSIGYDSIKGATDYTKDTKTGETVRNLREVKLYEVSLVTLAANELATMTALKGHQPSEGKPWRAVQENDVWKVYKLDADGEPTGKPLGEHETEEEAQEQVRALYVNVEEGGKVKPKAGRRMRSDKRELLSKLSELLTELAAWADYEDEEEEMEGEEHILEPAPEKAAVEPVSDKAGPETPTYDGLLRWIEIEQEQIKLLEV